MQVALLLHYLAAERRTNTDQFYLLHQNPIFCRIGELVWAIRFVVLTVYLHN